MRASAPTRGHPALRAIIEFLAENEPDWELAANVSTGPELFGHVLRWRPDVLIYPRDTFYPYHNHHQIRIPHELSYCEHLWEGSWTSEWKWTSSGFVRLDELKPSTTIRKLLAAGDGLFRAGLRLVTDTIARAVVRNAEKPLPSYPLRSKVVVSTIHGHQLLVDGYDYSITPRLARDGYLALRTERFVSKTVVGGDWFIDVGASIGQISLLAARRCGPYGRVFAFEPNPALAELLIESAVLNNFHDRLSVKQIAPSAATGKIWVRTLQPRSGCGAFANSNSKTVKDGQFDKRIQYMTDESVEVASEALDEIFPVDIPVKMMRVGADRLGDNVLAGAQRLLEARAFDYIMIDVLPEAGAAYWKKALVWFKQIESHGYCACTADDNGDLIWHASLARAASQITEGNIIFARVKTEQAATALAV